ncbi:MAG: hypothetical protein RI101_08565 [Nitrospira sp.]|jgi:hypothetical protein|nr:hypothetical protein [Nitrospira sp.]
MSWGYWGIVTGLVVLVANFFLCLSLVSGGSKETRQASSRMLEHPGKAEKPMPATTRRAA